MKYQITYTKQFKKDLKRIRRQNRDLEKLRTVINSLATGKTLAIRYRDHNLTGNWIGHRECHIESDWLLIYAIKNDKMSLSMTRTGTHSEIF